METLIANLIGLIRRETLNDREYIVAPLSMIVPGVLNGSRGPLFYSEQVVSTNPEMWNGMPMLLGHPKDAEGKPISGRAPDILNQYGLGFVFKSRAQGKLTAEGWFDVENTKRIDSRILHSLESGLPLNLSTGLSASIEEAPAGSVHNGTSYTHVVKSITPDHLAILPDEDGACSLKDGCGVLMNGVNDDEKRSIWQKLGQALGILNAVPATVENHIVEENGKWVLYSMDGTKKLGTFPSKEAAMKREAQVKQLKANNAMTKTEDGKSFPASDYAYVPDPQKPSTWKLRLTSTPGGSPDTGIVGAAVAALGKGFRGNKVEIPSGQLSAVKAKVRAAWLKANPDKSKEDLPPVLNERGIAMDRERVIAALVANCACSGFTEEDTETLNAMSDEQLDRMDKAMQKRKGQETVANAAVKGFTDEQGNVHAYNEKSGKWETKKNPPKKEAVVNSNGSSEGISPMTEEEWLKAQPASVQNTFRYAKGIEQREKERIINELTANVPDDKKEQLVNTLSAKTLDELATLQLISPPKPEPVVNQFELPSMYLGAAGARPTSNVSNKKRTGIRRQTLEQLLANEAKGDQN